MKKICFAILILFQSHFASAQNKETINLGHEIDKITYEYPPTWTAKGITFWCGSPIDTIVKNADFIFEGKILSDSIFYYRNSIVETYSQVLVLKQFKGKFTSDTIIVIIGGDNYAYAHKGDEAFFLASNNGNILTDYSGDGCGFIKICDKKDVAKEVYEPIEAVTGQKYIDVHPNTCARQKKK